MSRFLLIVLAVHIPLFFYPILRLCSWLDLSWWLTLLVFVPLAASQVISRVLLRHRVAPLARALRRLADLWLGLSPIVLLALLVAEVLVALGLVAASSAALWVIGSAALIGLLGIANAMLPRVKVIRFASAKLQQPVRFVQITDVHMGSRNKAFLDRVIQQINALAPDFLCITGDFIYFPG